MQESTIKSQTPAKAEASGVGFELVAAGADIDDETREMIEDEMEDLDGEGGIYCRRIKLPTGSSKAFEVESDNEGDPDMEKELTGVILFTHKMNARWDGEYSGGGAMPVCSSWDAKNGVFLETGESRQCDRCPYNVFRDEGGKECKNTRRIYMALNKRPYLYLLTVPPTSLKAVSTQLNRILSAGLPFTKTVLRFTLVAATSRSGKDFARISLEKVGVLSGEQHSITRQMRSQIKKQYQNIGIDDGDYNMTPRDDSEITAPSTEPDGFINVPEGVDDELPFD